MSWSKAAVTSTGYMSAGKSGIKALYAPSRIACCEGTIFLAVVRGIGTIAIVVLRVPVGVSAYCWAIGFGWLLVVHVSWAAMLNNTDERRSVASAVTWKTLTPGILDHRVRFG